MNTPVSRKLMLENLQKLKHLLPKGYTRIIAEKVGVTEVAVSNALLGRTRRFDIIEYAIELGEGNNKIAERLDNLVKSI